jgi:hypothetical protein
MVAVHGTPCAIPSRNSNRNITVGETDRNCSNICEMQLCFYADVVRIRKKDAYWESPVCRIVRNIHIRNYQSVFEANFVFCIH